MDWEQLTEQKFNRNAKAPDSSFSPSIANFSISIVLSRWSKIFSASEIPAIMHGFFTNSAASLSVWSSKQALLL